MSSTAPETYTKAAYASLSCTVDFGASSRPLTGQLDAGELLTGTPTVTQLSKTVAGADDITATGVTVNAAADEANGRTVAIGEGVQLLLPGGTAGCTYTFAVRCTTDAGRPLEGRITLTVE